MRTTLDVDDEVIAAVRSLARQRGRTMGQVVSDLVRQALAPRPAQEVRNGVPLFAPPPGRGPATMELVNALRDGEQDT
ncbi:MAG: CopG family transcriptional regulator [Armatimonadetes bacterium]|nr:CopG family transcriptional regulator [Armatimonadota bacterium]